MFFYLVIFVTLYQSVSHVNNVLSTLYSFKVSFAKRIEISGKINTKDAKDVRASSSKTKSED